jgi:hypothetical protein
MVAEGSSSVMPENDAYVKLSLLDGGSFVGETGKLHAGVSNVKFRMYNWAFYVSHRGRHVLWDLGLDEVCDLLRPMEACADTRLGSLMLHPVGEQIHARRSQPRWTQKKHRHPAE